MSSPNDLALVIIYKFSYQRNHWYMQRHSTFPYFLAFNKKLALYFGSSMTQSIQAYCRRANLRVFILYFPENQVIFLLKYNRYAISVHFIHSKQTNNGSKFTHFIFQPILKVIFNLLNMKIM